MTNAPQIHVTNGNSEMHGYFHEARKIMCNDCPEGLRERIVKISFGIEQALPLSKIKVFRLAQISPRGARMPARRSRAACGMAGKKSGAISRIMSTQWPDGGNSNNDGQPSRRPASQLALRRSLPRKKLARQIALKSQP